MLVVFFQLLHIVFNSFVCCSGSVLSCDADLGWKVATKNGLNAVIPAEALGWVRIEQAFHTARAEAFRSEGLLMRHWEVGRFFGCFVSQWRAFYIAQTVTNFFLNSTWQQMFVTSRKNFFVKKFGISLNIFFLHPFLLCNTDKQQQIYQLFTFVTHLMLNLSFHFYTSKLAWIWLICFAFFFAFHSNKFFSNGSNIWCRFSFIILLPNLCFLFFSPFSILCALFVLLFFIVLCRQLSLSFLFNRRLSRRQQ